MNLLNLQASAENLAAVGRAYGQAKALFALIGLATLVVVMALPALRDAVLGSLAAAMRASEPAGVLNVAAGPIQAGLQGELTGAAREQQAATQFLAKRYRVAQDAVGGFVAAAYRVGRDVAVDPLLILAIIAVESRFNPIAESAFGAKGLMQVIPKFHMQKLAHHGGADALLDPVVNIQVGAQALGEYLRRYGETAAALQMYAGAVDEQTSQYASKVLAERSRLEQALIKLRPSA